MLAQTKESIRGHLDCIQYHIPRGKYDAAMGHIEEINSLKNLHERWEKAEEIYNKANYNVPYNRNEREDFPQMAGLNMTIIELPTRANNPELFL